MFTSPRFKLKVSRVLSLEKFRRLWKRRLSVLEYKAHHKLFVGSRVQKSSYKELLHQKSYTPFYQFSTPRSQAQSLRRQIPVLRSTAPTIFGTACSQFNSLGVITDHLFRAALALLNLPPVKLVTPFKKLITPTLYPVLAPVPNFASGRAPVKPSSAYAASYTQQSTGKYFTLLSHVQRLKAQTPKYKVLNKVLARSRTSMNLKRAAISIFTASSKVSWLSLKRALARMNLKHRHGFKRPRTFAYYSYSVPREFVYGKFTRRFIPELPFALRGTFWNRSTLLPQPHLTESWAGGKSYELKRRVPSPVSTLEANLLIPNSDLRSLAHDMFGVGDSLPVQYSRKTLESQDALSDTFSINYPKVTRLQTLSNSLDKPRPYGAPSPTLSCDEDEETMPESYSALSSKSLIRLKTRLLPRLHSIPKRRPLRTAKKRRSRFRAIKRRHIKLFRRLLSKSRRFTRRWKYLNRRNRFWGRRAAARDSWLLRGIQKCLNKSRLIKTVGRALRFAAKQYRASPLNRAKRAFFKPRPKGLVKSLKSGLRKLNPLTKNPSTGLLTSLKLGALTYPKSSPRLSATSAHFPTNDSSLPQPHLTSLDSHLPTVLAAWSSPHLLRYALVLPQLSLNLPTQLPTSNTKVLTTKLQNQLSAYFFGDRSVDLKSLNTWSVPPLRYTLRKRLLQIATSDAFTPKVTAWYYRTLVRFMENCTGRKVALHFGPFVDSALTFEDKALCSVWAERVKGFQRILGHKIFVVEALDIVASALRLKDPTFLANWLRAMLKRMSFWKFRLLFRYLKFLITHLFQHRFQHFQFKGFKLRLKGKISVAGNARTRALHLRVGNTSHAKMSNRVAYDLSFIGTFTGVMGLKLWFFY